MSTLQDFLNECRVSLEDPGDVITDNFTGDNTTKRVKLSLFPIGTNSETITVGGVTQTKPTDYSINYDNGEVLFVTAPGTSVAVVFTYTKYVWRDERIISAINAGIRDMRARGIYNRFELYVQCQALKYDYDLTTTTDVPPASSFTDFTPPADYNPAVARGNIVKSKTRVHFAEYHPFGANQPFFPFYAYGRTSLRNFHIDGDPTPNDTIKLVCSAPLTPLVNTSDTFDGPDEMFMAPVWYCLSVLLEKKEAKRARSDGYATMQNENATPPGTQAQSAQDFWQRYLAVVEDGMPPMRMSQRRRRQSWENLSVVR